jgi:hypothetical protein
MVAGRQYVTCSYDESYFSYAILSSPEVAAMAKKRVTVTLDPDIADYLYEVPNTSAVVSEAVREYRARQLAKELEAAYSEDHDESAELAAEWEPADAKVNE